jgi:hypothetical protein
VPHTVTATVPFRLTRLGVVMSAEPGAVPDVVFPTAIEEIDGHQFVFYGMADSSIGVASLDRMDAP